MRTFRVGTLSSTLLTGRASTFERLSDLARHVHNVSSGQALQQLPVLRLCAVADVETALDDLRTVH